VAAIKKNRKTFEKELKENILATDGAKHGAHVLTFTTAVDAYVLDTSVPFPNKKILREMTLHLADLSNPCRPRAIAELWGKLVSKEFAHQGALELRSATRVRLPMFAPTTQFYASQVGFIGFMIRPFVLKFSQAFPKTRIMLTNVDANVVYYQTKIPASDFAISTIQ